jgi:hypothetical protein
VALVLEATILPSEPAGPDRQLRVETRYLRLGAPVALGDRIDGWRVCWLGGWDRSKVCFVVMVERVHPSVGAAFKKLATGRRLDLTLPPTEAFMWTAQKCLRHPTRLHANLPQPDAENRTSGGVGV